MKRLCIGIYRGPQYTSNDEHPRIHILERIFNDRAVFTLKQHVTIASHV